MMCIRFQIEVVRWCGIRGGGEVVGLGRDIEVLIAARSAEEIERPLSVRLPRADLTPPIGVDVTRDNEVDAARIECIHKDAPHITDAVLRLLYGLILSIGENVLVHEDDFPWGGGCRCIAFQPGELLLIQRRTARAALKELCIENDHVHGTKIKGIIVPAKCRAAVFGQGKGL